MNMANGTKWLHNPDPKRYEVRCLRIDSRVKKIPVLVKRTKGGR